jgi:hypothetical protein
MGLRGIGSRPRSIRSPGSLGEPPEHHDSPLSPDAMMELWLGRSHHGSLFRTRQELATAWRMHGERVSTLYAVPGRRVQGWWEFEAPAGLKRDYDTERSTLWAAGLLGDEERAELEREWRKEYQRAHQPNFVFHGRAGILKGAEAIAAHLAWADVPLKLLTEWAAQREQPMPAA